MKNGSSGRILHPIGRSYYFGFLIALSTVFVCSGFGDRLFSILGVNEIIRFYDPVLLKSADGKKFGLKTNAVK